MQNETGQLRFELVQIGKTLLAKLTFEDVESSSKGKKDYFMLRCNLKHELCIDLKVEGQSCERCGVLHLDTFLRPRPSERQKTPFREN